MAIWAHHPRADLLRYLTGEVEGGEKAVIEAHLTSCEDCRNYLSFVRDFRAGLSELTAEEFTTPEPCPDAWTIVAYERGDADEETSRRLRAHLVLCDACADLYYSLLRQRPKIVEVILRVARGLVECLHVSGVAERLPLPVTVAVRGPERLLLAPFEITQSLVDPETGLEHATTLRVEESLEKERVRVVVGADPPVPPEEKWKVRLAGSTEELPASMSLAGPQLIVARAIPYGFYALEILKEDDCLGRFLFSVEPFNLADAMDAALEHLGRAEYARALAILESAHERDPESREVLDVLCVGRALAACDADGRKHEEEVLTRFRGVRDFLQDTRNFFAEVKRRFGEGVGYLLAAAAFDPSMLPEDVAARLKREKPSLPLLRAVQLLSERARAADERLHQVQQEYTLLAERVSALLEELGRQIDAVRRDAAKDPDEKFGVIGTLLKRVSADMDTHGVSLPRYAPLFRGRLGDACWQWLGPEVQRIFAWAEGVYRFLGSHPVHEAPDFSPALLQFCRGFELLLNDKLGSVCLHIREVVKQRHDLQQLVKSQFPKMDLIRVFDMRGAVSITHVANFLRIGKLVQLRSPGALRSDVESLLASSPVLTDTLFCTLLHEVGSHFRNGKVHPYSDSPSTFTTLEEMHELRKLVFGFNEGLVASDPLLRHVQGAPGTSDTERRKACEQLLSEWREFPGLIAKLWRGLEEPRAS